MKALIPIFGTGVAIPILAATVRFYWTKHLERRNRG